MILFFRNRVLSLRFAIRGFYLLIKTESSIIAQLIVVYDGLSAGFYFDISKQDWINQLLVIGLVLAIEGLNTAVEKLADFVHQEIHPKIGFIKDIAAGAVTFAALTALIVIILIYYPYFLGYAE